MISAIDVGSLPPRIDVGALREGAGRSLTLLPLLGVSGGEAVGAFEDEVVGAFIDKLRAGLDFPNYPQFRDMNEMFLGLIGGIERGSGGYVALSTPNAKAGSKIPEVAVLRRNASRIRDEAGLDRVTVKACVTGPYTLASFFPGRTPKLLTDLGRALAEIVSRSISSTRRFGVALVSVDEPVFGLLDDPLIDYGSEGREALLRAWGDVLHAAASRGVETIMHLHDTSDGLFWEAESLGVVESHVDDPLYEQESTRERLEETDKRLKASLAVTIFDRLVEAKLRREGSGDIQQGVGEVWTEMRRGRVDPKAFMEDVALLRRRLERALERFGPERVPYAGPECGLGGWPSYEAAMECLRRVTEAVRAHNRGRG